MDPRIHVIRTGSRNWNGMKRVTFFLHWILLLGFLCILISCAEMHLTRVSSKFRGSLRACQSVPKWSSQSLRRYAATPLRPQIKIAVKCLEMFHVPTTYLLSWQLTRIKGFCHLPASKILEMLEVVSVANKIWILIFVVKGRWDESGNLRQRYCDFLCSNSRIW